MANERIQSLFKYLRPRYSNALARDDIWDYAQVEGMTDPQLRAIDGFGPRTVYEIRQLIPYREEPVLPDPEPVDLGVMPRTHPGSFQGIVDVEVCNGQAAGRLLRAGEGWELLGIYPRCRGMPAKDGAPFHVLKSITVVMGRREATKSR